MVGIQILVVEDNETQAKLVSFLLEQAGYTVRIAGSAEEALELLRFFSPGLILMDLQLPGMDGLELVRRLRLDPLHDTTPIIAVTVYADPSDLERAREAGCNGKISKPIDTATFARQVTQYMNPTAGIRADAPSDSHDLLAEIRNSFLAEGLEQCSRILKELNSESGCAIEVMQRVLHRWAGIAGTLGFPEICDQARAMEPLLNLASPEYTEIARAIEIAQRRFSNAARNRPKLPQELTQGLMNVRIGLVNFSESEAKRIRSAAQRTDAQIVIEQVEGESVELKTGYQALVVNECAVSARVARHRPDWPVPVVFIRSRSSLRALSQLPARTSDFLIAPWDAEEVLLRVHRLIAKASPSQPAPGSLNGQKSRPRVLIVDDDPDMVSMIYETLHPFDMDCEVAHDGNQALATVQRSLPDAIILDVNMFDLDGFEVLKRLRRNLVTKKIPVLLLTARGQESDITRGFGSGADDYLVKPFKPLDLVKRVDNLISTRRKERLLR